jgi:thioesterase domain-containing protein/acyl carrier protein
MSSTLDDSAEPGYVRPRDPIELWLARQWEDILGFTVGIRDNFFGMGGNSLDAARLVKAVEKRFGHRFALNAVTQNPTVESLAARLREANVPAPAGPLVEIQGGEESHPPLFLVHPMTGQVAPYCHLARALGDEFTVFGLQPAGLYDGAEPLATVAEMARRYVEAVRAADPAGPYCLGGCATGSVIAFEMARQLAADGAEVRLLAVLDIGLVEPELTGWRPRGAGDVPGTLFDMLVTPAGIESWFRELSRSRQLEWVLADWKAHQLVPPEESAEFVARSLRVWQAVEAATRDYRPQPYRGPVDHYRRGPDDGPGTSPRTADLPAAAHRIHECAAPDGGFHRRLTEAIGVKC